MRVKRRTSVHWKVMSLPALTSKVLFVPTFPPWLQAMSVLEISMTGPSSGILRMTRVGTGCMYLCGSRIGFHSRVMLNLLIRSNSGKIKRGYTYGSVKGRQPVAFRASAATDLT